LPQAGHLSNLDAPEAFNASVLDFLRQIAAGGQDVKTIPMCRSLLTDISWCTTDTRGHQGRHW
jgi:hypothetical protein